MSNRALADYTAQARNYRARLSDEPAVDDAPRPEDEATDSSEDSNGETASGEAGASTGTPHHEFVKAVLASKEEAVSLLSTALPAEVSACLDWSTLRPAPTEFVDKQLQRRFNDLLFEVELSAPASRKRRRVYVDVMFEHQSTGERMMALRLLGLLVRRHEQFRRKYPKRRRVPIVLPVVLFHGNEAKGVRGWTHPVSYSALLDADAATLDALSRFIPDFEFALDDLTQQSWPALQQRPLTTLMRLAMLMLKEVRSNPYLLQQMKNPAVLSAWQELTQRPDSAVVLVLFWRYIYRAGDFAAQQIEEFANTLGELAETTQMSTAQKLIEQAAPKLIADAAPALIEAAAPRLRAEGRAEGRTAVLKRLVARKFSECDTAALAAADARIDAASEEQLESWTDRILFVERLDELFVE